MKIIRGYRQGQQGGAVLVTIDNAPLGLPKLSREEARHSPDGFQFGYGGSGPAELARAILIALFPDDPIVRQPRCYQKFKWGFIAPIRGNEFTLLSSDIEKWFEGWKQTEVARPAG